MSAMLATPTSKTANGLADLALITPTKATHDLMSKLTAKQNASSEPEEEPIEEWRQRFVGDVDLDEKDEPLLKESQRRFVLFPIQYHEVCSRVTTRLIIADALFHA